MDNHNPAFLMPQFRYRTSRTLKLIQTVAETLVSEAEAGINSNRSGNFSFRRKPELIQTVAETLVSEGKLPVPVRVKLPLQVVNVNPSRLKIKQLIRKPDPKIN